ncbi:hypothetical protein [Emticicia agri]|uniref:Uncharacterized protein n=1 Tax=Emticicia agri TaxID=2492393 RepID=A0A4Q5M5W9_9BACT|nr:hypothetical protein [Emticicia agri]RYU97695.1 hypothetical protein EWM59_00805 [Emticicia agri]
MLSDLEIKPAFHQLIDKIEDKEYLKELYDSIAALLPQKDDILDGLNPDEIKKLEQSILQAKNGEITSDAIVRQKIVEKFGN